MEDSKTTQVTGTSTDTKKEEADGKTFTQEQLDKIVQERVAKEQSKAAEDRKKAVEEAKAEAERVAKLSQEEREKELLAKQNEELAQKDIELKLRENKLDAIEILNEAKIPVKFVDFVLDVNKDTMQERIATLKKNWDSSLSEAVAAQLAGKNPPKDFSNNSKDITKTKETSFVF